MKPHSRFFVLVWVALLFLPLYVFAADNLPAKSEVSSRFGVLKVLDVQDEQQLFIGKKPLPIAERLVGIEQAWQVGGKDVFLVSMTSGGTACPLTYVFVMLEPKRGYMSEFFGNCSEQPDVLHLGSRILVKFARMSRANPALVVEFDDGAVFEGKKKLKLEAFMF